MDFEKHKDLYTITIPEYKYAKLAEILYINFKPCVNEA